MNIALIGGVERGQIDLQHLAREAGHELEYHSGDTGGRGAAGLRSLIERADLVVFQTAVNSHGSMYLAKRLSRQLGKNFIVLRNCGRARLAAFLEELARKPETSRESSRHRGTAA